MTADRLPKCTLRNKIC